MSTIESHGDNARIAGRDLIERLEIRVADEPIEGSEIGDCIKCGRRLWIHATECIHCGYNPAIEQQIAMQVELAQRMERERIVNRLIVQKVFWMVLGAPLVFRFVRWQWVRESDTSQWRYMVAVGVFFVLTYVLGTVFEHIAAELAWRIKHGLRRLFSSRRA